MKKYRIARSFGFAGDVEYDVVEASTIAEAEDLAYQWAEERVDVWAEEYDPELHDSTY